MANLSDYAPTAGTASASGDGVVTEEAWKVLAGSARWWGGILTLAMLAHRDPRCGRSPAVSIW